MDLSLVAPDSTPLHFVKLVSLPPVGFLNWLCLIWIAFVCYAHLIIFTWNLCNINVNFFLFFQLVRWYASWTDSTHHHVVLPQWLGRCCSTWRQVKIEVTGVSLSARHQADLRGSLSNILFGTVPVFARRLSKSLLKSGLFEVKQTMTLLVIVCIVSLVLDFLPGCHILMPSVKHFIETPEVTILEILSWCE